MPPAISVKMSFHSGRQSRLYAV